MTPDKLASLANDLECTIATLKAIANELATTYTDSSKLEQETVPIPPTLKEITAVFAAKHRMGATSQLKALLGKYGVAKLSEISPKDYATLLKDVEGIE